MPAGAVEREGLLLLVIHELVLRVAQFIAGVMN